MKQLILTMLALLFGSLAVHAQTVPGPVESWQKCDMAESIAAGDDMASQNQTLWNMLYPSEDPANLNCPLYTAHDVSCLLASAAADSNDPEHITAVTLWEQVAGSPPASADPYCTGTDGDELDWGVSVAPARLSCSFYWCGNTGAPCTCMTCYSYPRYLYFHICPSGAGRLIFYQGPCVLINGQCV